VLAARTPPKPPAPPPPRSPEPPQAKAPDPEPPPADPPAAIIPVLEARSEPRPPSQTTTLPPRTDSSASRAISGEIGLVMPTLATSRPAQEPRPTAPEPRAAEPTPAPTPASEPTPEPRQGLDVQLVQTPSATPTGAPVVIPTLTRGGFHIDVDDDEAEALDRLSPMSGPEIGIPSDDADGEDFMSAVAAATPLMSSSSPADSDVHHEVHLEDVIEDLEPETIDAEPEPPPRAPSGPMVSADRPSVPPPPVEKAVDKPPPPPVEKVADKPPPPPDKPPPPVEKAADKPPPPPSAPPRPPAAPPPAAAAKPAAPPPAATAKPAAPSPPSPALAAAAAGQSGRKRGWYDEAFGEHFASMTPHDSDASAELDAAFIRKTAELGAGQTVLDIGCGDGRHCFALANLGLMVTGFECSLPQLVRAAQRNEATDAGITLLQGDMRSLPRDRTYDAVTCLGSTLGYFETEEQNRQSLQEMVDVLRPGGKLILQMVNRDYLVAVLPCRSWWQGRGCLVLDVADMNYLTNRMRVHRTVVFEDGRQFEHHMYIRAFSLHDLGRMLSTMGMRVLEVSGSRDTRGRFYGATSAEIWLIAQREA
jgi:SAM-dependent methyltransferase